MKILKDFWSTLDYFKVLGLKWGYPHHLKKNFFAFSHHSEGILKKCELSHIFFLNEGFPNVILVGLFYDRMNQSLSWMCVLWSLDILFIKTAPILIKSRTNRV